MYYCILCVDSLYPAPSTKPRNMYIYIYIHIRRDDDDEDDEGDDDHDDDDDNDDKDDTKCETVVKKRVLDTARPRKQAQT